VSKKHLNCVCRYCPDVPISWMCRAFSLRLVKSPGSLEIEALLPSALAVFSSAVFAHPELGSGESSPWFMLVEVILDTPRRLIFPQSGQDQIRYRSSVDLFRYDGKAFDSKGSFGGWGFERKDLTTSTHHKRRTN
jgi:hypothetical protein